MNPKLVLVTGGNRGIGYELVHQFAKLNATVIFTSRNPHDGQKVMSKHRELHSKLIYYPLDVSDNASVQELGKALSNRFGYLDVLINNAATNYDNWQTVSNVNITEVEYTLNVNLLGPWRMCNVCIPLLEKGNNSLILNISSGAGRVANIDGKTPAYSISKNGLNMLTKALAADLHEKAIRVNAVCPGWVRTRMGGLLHRNHRPWLLLQF